MNDLKINLGSGSRPLPGFVNVDALADAPGVDVVTDISEPLPFEDGSAELIYAAHILEHFPTDQVPMLLRDWRRVLRDGGQLLVGVPDLDVIARTLVERSGWFTPPHGPWLGAIYGGQKDAYDFHKTGFNAPWLAYLLAEAGFGTVRREERFVDIGVMDATVSPLPFGANMSLNMRAIAGDGTLPALRRMPVERAFDVIDRALLFMFVVSTSIRARIMARRRRKIERAL